MLEQEMVFQGPNLQRGIQHRGWMFDRKWHNSSHLVAEDCRAGLQTSLFLTKPSGSQFPAANTQQFGHSWSELFVTSLKCSQNWTDLNWISRLQNISMIQCMLCYVCLDFIKWYGQWSILYSWTSQMIYHSQRFTLFADCIPNKQSCMYRTYRCLCFTLYVYITLWGYEVTTLMPQIWCWALRCLE